MRKYAGDLAASEARLATLRDSQSAGRQKTVALQAELNDLIAKLSF